MTEFVRPQMAIVAHGRSSGFLTNFSTKIVLDAGLIGEVE